jgi:hypothetical protein
VILANRSRMSIVPGVGDVRRDEVILTDGQAADERGADEDGGLTNGLTDFLVRAEIAADVKLVGRRRLIEKVPCGSTIEPATSGTT